MQFITDIKDDVKLLQALYKATEPVKEYMEKTGYAERLSKKAKLTGKETDEEKKAIVLAQSKENIADAVLSAFGEYPEETLKLAHSLMVLEENEKPPHGMPLVSCVMDMLTNDTLLTFFMRSGALVLK